MIFMAVMVVVVVMVVAVVMGAVIFVILSEFLVHPSRSQPRMPYF